MTDCAFETARLCVAGWPARPEDSGASELTAFVVRLLSPAVTARLPHAWQGHFTEERARRWIEARDAEANVCVVSGRGGEPVGLMILHDSEGAEPTRAVRLGYLIAQSEWGKGYATELVRGFVDWAGTAGCARILAGVARDNPASIRVLEKAGFEEEPTDGGSETFYSIDLA